MNKIVIPYLITKVNGNHFLNNGQIINIFIYLCVLRSKRLFYKLRHKLWWFPQMITCSATIVYKVLAIIVVGATKKISVGLAKPALIL
jgi:hypothetical protein